MLQSIACFQCRQVWQFAPPLGRRDTCSTCRADAHVCRNCRFYDAKAYHECREPQAEWVKEKNVANFCDHFSPLTKQELHLAQDTKSKLDALFGSGGANSEELTPTDLSPADRVTRDLEEFLKKRK